MLQKFFNLAGALALVCTLAACTQPATPTEDIQQTVQAIVQQTMDAAQLAGEATAAAPQLAQDAPLNEAELSPAQAVCNEMISYTSVHFNGVPATIMPATFNESEHGFVGEGCTFFPAQKKIL